MKTGIPLLDSLVLGVAVVAGVPGAPVGAGVVAGAAALAVNVALADAGAVVDDAVADDEVVARWPEPLQPTVSIASMNTRPASVLDIEVTLTTCVRRYGKSPAFRR